MTNDITVRVGADAGPLRRGMNAASRSVSDFSAETKKMAVDVAKAGAVVVTAVSAIGAGVLKMASEAAQVGVEIKNLAAVAGTSTDNFQRMAAASRTVGVEQDKLADILKDVNDKFGDYMETGAGPLADFFENIAPKIGVTADQFANLAGPDALQLYVSSLEKAGVNQQQMTFYMEALASDATALLPLLRDNGKEMARLGDEAARLGLILSQETIDAAVEMDRELAVMANTLKTKATAAILEHKTELVALINYITEKVIPALSGLAGHVADIAEGWREIARAADAAIGPLARAAGLSAPTSFANSESPENAAARQADIDRTNAMGGGDTSATGTGYIDANGNWVEYGTGASTPTQPGINAPSLPMTTGTPLDPSGGLLPEKSLEQRLREAWESTQEIQEEIETGTAEHSQRLIDIATRQAEEETRLREAAAAREIQIRSKTINMAIGLFANLGRESEVFAKAAVALNAAKSISEAIQNTSVAYTKALTVDPTGVMAARVALLGKAQIGIIAANAALNLSNRSGGGASGGGGSVSAPSQGGGQEQAPSITQNRSLTLIGDNFNRKQAIDIAEYMNEGTDNGLIIRGRG